MSAASPAAAGWRSDAAVAGGGSVHRFAAAILPVVLVLAGCSGEPGSGRSQNTDIAAAATAAQGDIDTYAGNSLAGPAPSPAASAPAAAARNSATDEDAVAARAVVQGYYAAIAAGRFADAYRAWDDDGAASGMTRQAFAESFERYASYRAQLGEPGRIDAGAGQRHVQVPVRITGRLADGDRPFTLAGALTLHRVADIDGASAAQRRWRISDSAVRPQPGEVATANDPVRYVCDGDTRISVRFDADADTARLDRGGRAPVTMAGQRPASGIWYRGEGYELRGKGREARFTAPGATAIACTAG